MSSFYEGDQDPEIDDDDVESSSSQPVQAPTSLFGSGATQKGDNKSKNKYNVGGARIVTLNNMASDDEEDDGSGQVCLFVSSIASLILNEIDELNRHFMLVDQIHRANKYWVLHVKTKISCRIFSNQQKKLALKLSKIHNKADRVEVAGKITNLKLKCSHSKQNISEFH